MLEYLTFLVHHLKKNYIYLILKVYYCYFNMNCTTVFNIILIFFFFFFFFFLQYVIYMNCNIILIVH